MLVPFFRAVSVGLVALLDRLPGVERAVIPARTSPSSPARRPCTAHDRAGRSTPFPAR